MKFDKKNQVGWKTKLHEKLKFGKKTKVGNFSYRPGGAFSRIRGFARRNPVLSLVGYDALKNLQVPRVEKPTRTGRVSAGT